MKGLKNFLKTFFALNIIATPLYAKNLDFQKGYIQGINDEYKLMIAEQSITIPSTKYWLVWDISDKKTTDVIYVMIQAIKQNLTPVAIWLNGRNYLILEGDNNKQNLKSDIPILEDKIGLKNLSIIETSSNAYKIFINPTKQCFYPIYDEFALIHNLKEQILEDKTLSTKDKTYIFQLLNMIETFLKKKKYGSSE